MKNIDAEIINANKSIAVVIPVLNEEGAIGHVIQDIPSFVNTVVVVDNGSTDRSKEVARQAGALVVDEPKRGYGYACQRGINEVQDADIIVFLDGDYSDDPKEMEYLILPIVEGLADFSIGSRVRGKRVPGAMPWHALMGNKLFSFILRIWFGILVTDIGPFRAIKNEKFRQLRLKEFTYGWTLEMMIKAAQQNYRFVEVPVSYKKRIGKSKVSGSVWGSVKAAVKMIFTLRYCFIPKNSSMESKV